jgi:hypothetical protein
MKRSKKRSGDVLGLGDAGSSITNQEQGSPDRSEGVTEEERRRRRMSEGADELTSGGSGAHHGGSGATGIDMGAGGEGTDIE